jgi:ribosomal protein L37E
MSHTKCPRCGHVNWMMPEVCERCGAPLDSDAREGAEKDKEYELVF